MNITKEFRQLMILYFVFTFIIGVFVGAIGCAILTGGLIG